MSYHVIAPLFIYASRRQVKENGTSKGRSRRELFGQSPSVLYFPLSRGLHKSCYKFPAATQSVCTSLASVPSTVVHAKRGSIARLSSQSITTHCTCRDVFYKPCMQRRFGFQHGMRINAKNPTAKTLTVWQCCRILIKILIGYSGCFYNS